MITDKQIKSIHDIIEGMKHCDIIFLNEFQPEEVEYIMQCIKNQTGAKGYCIETNGNSSDPKSITKFRKRYEKFRNLKPKQ